MKSDSTSSSQTFSFFLSLPFFLVVCVSVLLLLEGFRNVFVSRDFESEELGFILFFRDSVHVKSVSKIALEIKFCHIWFKRLTLCFILDIHAACKNTSEVSVL